MPKVAQTKLEKILSVFNQRWVFDKDSRWLMRYSDETDDEDQSLIVNHLALAVESEEIQNNIFAEETFEASLDQALREKERIIEQKELVIEQKELVIEEQEIALEAERQKNEELLRRIVELEHLMKK